MQLEQLWKQYKDRVFNYTSLNETVKQRAVKVTFAPKAIITNAGEYPEYVYFLISGTVQGVRTYQSGNSYHYFTLTSEDGSVGLLELLAQESKYVATIVALTPVTAYRVEAPIIYQMIMEDIQLLRRCVGLVSHDLYLRSQNDGLLYYHNGIDRVCYFLVNYYSNHTKDGQSVLLETDYQTIANNIGVSLRTVVRSIQMLKKEGSITSAKKKIFITYPQYEKLCSRL